MARKIAMIGAGSVVFCKTLISDIMATPALSDSEFALMDLSEIKLRRMETFVKRMIKDNGLQASVYATTNRQDAIKNADFVVVMMQVGGMEAFGVDYNIPLKYGVDQCIGDTPGARRRVPRSAERAGAGRHRQGHGKARQAPRHHAPVRQPDGRQLPGPGANLQGALRGPLPRRADDAGPNRRLLRRAQGPRSPTPAAASTTWTGSCGWSIRAATSTRCSASYSKSPSITRTKRSAARCSATSAIS